MVRYRGRIIKHRSKSNNQDSRLAKLWELLTQCQSQQTLVARASVSLSCLEGLSTYHRPNTNRATLGVQAIA
jgi:hypothetical protein